MASRLLAVIIIAASATVVGGRVTASMQRYADLRSPTHSIQHIAAIALPSLIPALANEASKRGVALEDANVILPQRGNTMKLRFTKEWPRTGSVFS